MKEIIIPAKQIAEEVKEIKSFYCSSNGDFSVTIGTSDSPDSSNFISGRLSQEDLTTLYSIIERSLLQVDNTLQIRDKAEAPIEGPVEEPMGEPLSEGEVISQPEA